MGNRAAIYFQDYDRDGQEQPAIGLYMHYNGGPESIYAFTKELATYANSQRGGNGSPQVSTDAMAVRFIQLTTNFMNGTKSDFLNVYMVADPGSPKENRIETENDVYVIRPDFAIDRFDDETGRKWTHEEKLDEFKSVQSHHYWTGEDWQLKKQGLPTPDEDKHSIHESIREMNDGAFLKDYSYINKESRTLERKEATLPIEKELAASLGVSAEQQPDLAKVASNARREEPTASGVVSAQNQPSLAKVAGKAQKELEL